MTLGLDPTSQFVKFRVPRGLWQRQHFTDALAVYERGRRPGWQTSTSHFYHAAFAIATAYAIMGDKPRAVSWLQRTARDGMPAYELFAHDPALASLKGTPAFDAFMRRLKDEYDGYRRILATAP